MDKKRILQYQKKYAQEKKDNKSRNEKPKNVLNTPNKKQKEIQVKSKTSKKNLSKSTDQKDIPPKVIESDHKQKTQHSKFVNHTNNNNYSNINDKHNQQNQLNKIKGRNKNEQKESLNDINNNDENHKLKIFKEKTTYKLEVISGNNTLNTETNKKKRRKKNKEDNNEDNNIMDNNNTNNIINTENNNSSLRKMRRGSVKINLIYSKFINNLRIKMEKYEEEEKHKNKNRKILLSNYLHKFINITRKDDILFNTSINSFSFPRKYERYSRKISSNFKRKLKSSNMHFSIESNINKSQINTDKIIELEKELEIKNNKINELLEMIERQNTEYSKLKSYYNDIIIQNENLKNNYYEIFNQNQKLNNIYKEIIIQNEKLKEENNNLKNSKSNIFIENNECNVDNSNFINSNNNNTKNDEKQKYNNLITYNINKNNNYNIINSEINNINNVIQKDMNKETIIIENSIESINTKEKQDEKIMSIKDEEQLKKEEKEKKANKAFERFKRNNKRNFSNKESDYQKSDKISNIAKMLESQIGKEEGRKNSINIRIVDNEKFGFNNDIIDLIDHKPVIDKKKKKIRNFSFDG